MSTLADISAYLAHQGIVVSQAKVLPSFISYSSRDKSIEWSHLALQTDHKLSIESSDIESMSLASMAAVHMMDAKSGDRILDVCAAPGMKSLYLAKLIPSIDLHSNDLSGARIIRMKRIFAKHGVDSAVTKYDARYINKFIDNESFDRILLDAPCSGEGVILGGNTKLLDTWSPAKVKRLQQLQIKVLKSSWQLLKPGGRLVYATCTLNKNENERVIKKALGITLKVHEATLDTNILHMMNNAQAWRILPSENSIGFFIAVLEKNTEIE